MQHRRDRRDRRDRLILITTVLDHQARDHQQMGWIRDLRATAAHLPMHLLRQRHRGKEALSQCGRRAAHLAARPGRDPVSCAPGRDLLQLLVRSLLDHGGRTGEHET
jgi:hypothetical protein